MALSHPRAGTALALTVRTNSGVLDVEEMAAFTMLGLPMPDYVQVVRHWLEVSRVHARTHLAGVVQIDAVSDGADEGGIAETVSAPTTPLPPAVAVSAAVDTAPPNPAAGK